MQYDEIAVVVALTEMAKRLYRAATGKNLGDWAILVAVCFGIALRLMKPTPSDADIISGIVVGLIAAGLYGAAVSVAKKASPAQ